MPNQVSTEIQTWPIDKLVVYARNPRKNDAAVDRMCGSIREFGFKIPCLVRSDGELIDGLVRNLVMDCGDYLKLNTPGFVRVCHVEAIDRKLDLIAAQLAQLSPPDKETATAGSSAPVLQVIQGGAI